MWLRVGKYILYSLMWSAVVGYVIYSASLSRAHRQSQRVESVDIIISDSAMHGNLITTSMARQWIADSQVKLHGELVSTLPLEYLESRMLRNGFVERVKIYPTYSGVLKVELSQRSPRVRLMMNGYNGYVTDKGYVFEAPTSASLYVPIITGAYRPPFPPSYVGDVNLYMKRESQRLQDQIIEVEREKYPLFERQEENMENMRELRRMFIKKGWFESTKAFDKRVEELREKKADLRRLYRYRANTISKEIAKVSAKQQQIQNDEKKLRKRCEDFANLINFVYIVENDKFWSSEIVQIIASESPSGELRVNLVVRSGNFEVVFGSVAPNGEGFYGGNDNKKYGVEQKLDRLFEFYQSGLRRVGWDKYKTINVEYKNQIVCK